VEVPPGAAADFERALNAMRAGNAVEAELDLKQLAETYPQLSAPHVNLGILYRKQGKLEQAEQALDTATQRNSSSAVAWNELGVTRRMRGRFQESAEAYERALAADPNFAPAHRNYAVLLDLYLGDAERALTELERYQQLAGEEKPVTGWIAELRQRTGRPAAPRPDATPPPDSPALEPSGTEPQATEPAGA
jgi:tetratricopeptide (TPR) repeat protein